MNILSQQPAHVALRAQRPGSSSAPRFSCTEVKDDYAGGCGQDHSLYQKMNFVAGRPQIELPGSFPSSRIGLGEPDDFAGRTLKQYLGDVPKDCYYCEETGKCPLDVPEWGSGRDYMGAKCNDCSGSGICQRCMGDGIIGKPAGNSSFFGTA